MFDHFEEKREKYAIAERLKHIERAQQIESLRDGTGRWAMTADGSFVIVPKLKDQDQPR